MSQRWNYRKDGGDQLERWLQGKGKMWLSKADRVLGSSMELSQAVPVKHSHHSSEQGQHVWDEELIIFC